MTLCEVPRKIRTYLVCDGCGYSMGWGDPRLDLTVHQHDSLGYMRTTELHFHLDPPLKTTESNSRDCLGYWWKNRKAREKQEGKT